MIKEWYSKANYNKIKQSAIFCNLLWKLADEQTCNQSSKSCSVKKMFCLELLESQINSVPGLEQVEPVKQNKVRIYFFISDR